MKGRPVRFKSIVDLGLGVFNPKHIPRHTIDYMIREFNLMGYSIASERTDTIGYLIKYCEDKNIPYLVSSWNGLTHIKKL